MSKKKTKPSNCVKPPKRITLDQYVKSANEVLRNANKAQPTAVLNDQGQVIMTVGLNGRTFFPDPKPDPLDAIADA